MAAGYCLETSFLPCSLQSLVKCLPRFPFSFSITPLFLQEFYLPQVFQESKYRKCIFKKIFFAYGKLAFPLCFTSFSVIIQGNGLIVTVSYIYHSVLFLFSPLPLPSPSPPPVGPLPKY